MSEMWIARMTPATVSTVARELINIETGASAVVVLHEAQISFLTTIIESMAVALCLSTTTGVVGSTVVLKCVTNPMAGLTPNCTGYGPAGSTNATGLSYLDSQYINTLNGYHYLPIPELRPQIKPTGNVVLRIDSTHPTDIIVDAWIKFEEN